MSKPNLPPIFVPYEEGPQSGDQRVQAWDKRVPWSQPWDESTGKPTQTYVPHECSRRSRRGGGPPKNYVARPVESRASVAERVPTIKSAVPRYPTGVSRNNAMPTGNLFH
jgi:hypothetical protein